MFKKTNQTKKKPSPKHMHCTAWDKEMYAFRIKGELDLKSPGCLQLQTAEG